MPRNSPRFGGDFFGLCWIRGGRDNRADHCAASFISGGRDGAESFPCRNRIDRGGILTRMNEHSPASMQVDAFSRRHLLMTVGRTPQVVTETIYALAMRSPPEAFVPTELHLVTTEEGRRQAELELLDSGHARLGALCVELGLDRAALRFDRSTIHVVRDAAGRPLEDIRTVADNEAGADAIVGLVRHLTADVDSALHVSLAGGRKTMGFYLGYALSLFGRPQDRLSHVLVDPRFENLADFYYPSTESRILRLHNGLTVDARDARIELADIPVVSLRGLLGPELLGDGDTSYARIVQRARRDIGTPPRLLVDLRRLSLIAGVVPVRLKTPEFIWYALFAKRAQAGAQGIGWRNLDSRDAVLQLRALADKVGWHGGERVDPEAWIEGDSLSISASDRIVSRLNKQLRDALGPGPATPYRIARTGPRAASRYRLGLPTHCIHLVE